VIAVCTTSLQAGELAFITPTSVSVTTYSYSPPTGRMVINWGTQIVSVDLATRTIVDTYNISAGWVAHDTMVDPCSGEVYIPMNWTWPAGVMALSDTLEPLWQYVLPRDQAPQKSFVQTVRGVAVFCRLAGWTSSALGRAWTCQDDPMVLCLSFRFEHRGKGLVKELSLRFLRALPSTARRICSSKCLPLER